MIAIENARLFREQQEALERQTAMAEVLRIVSQSPTDPSPVFDAVCEAAARLLQSEGATLWQVDPEKRVPIGWSSPERQFTTTVSPPVDDSATGKAIATGRPARNHLNPENWPAFANASSRPGMHMPQEAIAVPIVLRGSPVVALTVVRHRPQPYTEADEQLLEAFASQAVIAMENARLFREQQEALERQTAMAEVLEIIAESPTNAAVLDGIVERAAALLGRQRPRSPTWSTAVPKWWPTGRAR